MTIETINVEMRDGVVVSQENANAFSNFPKRHCIEYLCTSLGYLALLLSVIFLIKVGVKSIDGWVLTLSCFLNSFFFLLYKDHLFNLPINKQQSLGIRQGFFTIFALVVSLVLVVLATYFVFCDKPDWINL